MRASQRGTFTAGQHFPILDGLRGIAVVMVIFCHFVAYGFPHPPSRLLTTLGSIGGTGVDLFFVLSGFLITRILRSTKGAPGFLSTFFIRRALRIMPLYYGFLFIAYVAAPLLHLVPWTPFSTQWWFWTYLQNVGMTRPGGLEGQPHFWSLAVEEHFYLLWPFLVQRCSDRTLAVVLLSMVPFSMIFRWALISAGIGAAYLTPGRLDGLALGSLLAIVATGPAPVGALMARARAYWLPLGLAIAGVSWFSGTSLPVVQVVKYTLTAAAYAGVLSIALAASPDQWLHRLLTGSTLRAIGKYSYGMYVLHLTVLDAYVRWCAGVWPVVGFVVLLSATFGVAAIVWHLWERPFLNLKERFTVPRSPALHTPGLARIGEVS